MDFLTIIKCWGVEQTIMHPSHSKWPEKVQHSRKCCCTNCQIHFNSIHTQLSTQAPVCSQKWLLRRCHRRGTVLARPGCSPTGSGWAACGWSPGGPCWSHRWARRWGTGPRPPGPRRCERGRCCSCRLEGQTTQVVKRYGLMSSREPNA